MLAPSTNWPPDYKEISDRRLQLVRWLKEVPGFAKGARYTYSHTGIEGCIEFIEVWVDTFDPRNAGTDKPTRLPFILFKRQREFLEFLYACFTSEADGLVEKSRDMGATWLCAAFSVWAFLFVPGSDIGWGSRKADSVDQIGDMSSIFEKMRYILRTIPKELWPIGFSEDNMSYMRITEPSGNSIVGESGDDIGRGGRTKMYFKDESAHYEHPEMVEASLGDNTRIQIDISSVNGLGNVFHRKREAGIEWSGGPARRGVTNVFVMDWTDHPEKTQEWYAQREQKAIADGLLHKFRQEVDRNYAASVEGVIIPAEWVKSAIDADVKLSIEDCGRGWYAGLDVADGGGDTNALCARRGIKLQHSSEWGLPDVGATTRRAVAELRELVPVNSKGRRPIKVMYDSIGVGSGVKAEANRLTEDETPEDQRMPAGMTFHSWNAGAKVINPEEPVVEGSFDGEVPLNKDFFANLKAQAWWSVRRRFEKTHRCIEAGKLLFPLEELVVIPSDLPNLRTLQKELSQPVRKMDSVSIKMVIDKKPQGTKSPNSADAFVECYFPVESMDYDSTLDWL